MRDSDTILAHGTKGLVKYLRADGWAMKVTLGYDEPRSAHVFDARTVDGWYRHPNRATLAHTPADRLDMTDDDASAFATMLVADHLRRRQSTVVIARDGVETLHPFVEAEELPALRNALPPSPPRVRTAPDDPRRRIGRRPKVDPPGVKFSVAAGVLGCPLLRGGNGACPQRGLPPLRSLACHGGGVGMLQLIVLGLRAQKVAWNRRRRGQFVECGYDRSCLARLDPCPECSAGPWYRG